MFSIEMLVGLRKAWAGDHLHEETGTYGGRESGLFAHERLEVYQIALESMAWFHALPGGPELSSRLARQIDKALTSVVLNIAERNGRYSEADRGNFVETAESSTIKAAAYLDLSERMGEVDRKQRDCGMALLDRVALMLRGLSRLG